MLNAKQEEVIRRLDGFALCTLDISPLHNTSADTIANVKLSALNAVLRAGGLSIVDEMSIDGWKSFCSKIMTTLNNRKSESEEIHPTVRELFAECNRLSGDKFRIVNEMYQEEVVNVLRRPNISLMVKVAPCGEETMEHVVLPVEIKKFDDLRTAMHRALGRLLNKLRNLLDVYGFSVKLQGYCIGTDGLHIAVGYAQIESDELTVLSTGGDRNPFWGVAVKHNKPSTYPPSETLGVRVLRTLLACTPQELGHNITAPPSRDAYGWSLTPVSVLGRGAFATVFVAQACRATAATVTVVMKAEGVLGGRKRHDSLAQLQNECEVLRKFNSALSACNNLPKLLDAEWTVSVDVPFVPLLPVGHPLELRCAEVEPALRRQEAKKLYEHATAALRAAHSIQVCHRDVRPQNVVYNKVTKAYVVIDWGLSATPGVPMHQHEGGRPFWHDDIVEARDDDQDIDYLPEHDLASALYVAYAFSTDCEFSVSWEDKAAYLVSERAAEVQDFLTFLGN